jgi:hypothetical protein
MPKGKKVCPACQKEHGARKLKCECGHVFGGATKPDKQGRKIKQTKHPLGLEYVPEPGLWVFDRGDLPKVHAPADLPSGPIDNQEVYDYVTYNSLGSSIFSEIPARRIADPKLRKLWEKAKKAMNEVWGYLTDEQTTV